MCASFRADYDLKQNDKFSFLMPCPINDQIFVMIKLLNFISGLPTSVLQKAAAKSREFEVTYGKQNKASSGNNNDRSWVDEMTVIYKKLTHAATNLGFQENSNINSFSLLQDKARALLLRC